MITNVYNPDTKELVQSWSDRDPKCRAMRGLEPINEACGGCVGCMELQAIHYGYHLEKEYEDFNEYWDFRIECYKKYAKYAFERPNLLNMLHDEALYLWTELHKERPKCQDK